MGRKSILEALDAAISNISQDNGYNNNIKMHTSGFVSYTELAANKFPAICLATGFSDYTPLTAEKYTSGNSMQGIDGWFISTIGYIKESTQELISSKMENLIEDILKAVLEDHHLGLASYVQNVILKKINPYLDLAENIGIVEIIWAVKYDFEKGNP